MLLDIFQYILFISSRFSLQSKVKSIINVMTLVQWTFQSAGLSFSTKIE